MNDYEKCPYCDQLKDCSKISQTGRYICLKCYKSENKQLNLIKHPNLDEKSIRALGLWEE